ncbi:MAG: zinc ribbon domain-containing protein [Caldilineaceae bacterium]|nr:zinc ribbon domain-containing protein [Caldilineaceae bacterium]
MPIYEYVCSDCRQQVTLFFRSVRQAEEEEARCPHCGGVRLQRRVSRINAPKSEERRLEELASSSDLMKGLEQEDPRALAAFMHQMEGVTGESLDEETKADVERFAAGDDA